MGLPIDLDIEVPRIPRPSRVEAPNRHALQALRSEVAAALTAIDRAIEQAACHEASQRPPAPTEDGQLPSNYNNNVPQDGRARSTARDTDAVMAMEYPHRRPNSVGNTRGRGVGIRNGRSSDYTLVFDHISGDSSEAVTRSQTGIRGDLQTLLRQGNTEALRHLDRMAIIGEPLMDAEIATDDGSPLTRQSRNGTTSAGGPSLQGVSASTGSPVGSQPRQPAAMVDGNLPILRARLRRAIPNTPMLTTTVATFSEDTLEGNFPHAAPHEEENRTNLERNRQIQEHEAVLRWIRYGLPHGRWRQD